MYFMYSLILISILPLYFMNPSITFVNLVLPDLHPLHQSTCNESSCVSGIRGFSSVIKQCQILPYSNGNYLPCISHIHLHSWSMNELCKTVPNEIMLVQQVVRRETTWVIPTIHSLGPINATLDPTGDIF